MFIKSVKNKNSIKLIIKKSVFYSYVYPISSEANVKPILTELKKKHKQAKHIAYAYKISEADSSHYEDKNKEICLREEERYNDDGEPSKTAGYPLLRIIHNKKLTNVLIVVARVFGGIKLGMSGLMNAYSSAGELALKESEVIEKEICDSIQIITTLDKYAELESLLKKESISYKSVFSGNFVKVIIDIPLEKKSVLSRWISD